MSGIGVVFNRSGRAAPVEPVLQAMAAAITDLGRDRTTVVNLGRVGFVHTLRSGLTPQDRYEQQPVRARGGQITMVFDGRIDNRDEIRRSLGLAMQDISSTSDSELFSLVWQRWGHEAANIVIGPFAAIVWDARRGELTAVRDPLGERVLHWHETPDRVIVGSAPRAIHACGIAREVDEIKVADSLILNYNEAERTYYKGISRLPMGHRLHVSDAGCRVTSYRDVTEVEPLHLATDDDYLEAARDVLDTAVRAVLRTVGSPSLMLSSGLDSTMVAAAASPILVERGERLHTYTSVPIERWRPRPGWNRNGDESGGVDAFLAMHPQLVHTYVRVPERGLLDYLDSTIAATDGPVRNGMNLYWIHEINRLTRERGARVVLTGGAGNLTLGWAGDSLAGELLADRRWRALWGELRASRGRGGFGGEVHRRLIDPRLPRSVWARLQRMRGNEVDGWSSYSAMSAKSPFAPAVDERAAALGFDADFRGPRDRAGLVAAMMGNAANERGDVHQGIEAVHGTETRDPTLDRRVVEFAFSLPTTQYRRDGQSRWLQRRLLAGQAPPEVLGPRVKRGRQAADARLRMAGERVQFRRDLDLFAQDPLLSSMLDIDRLRGIIGRGEWWEQDQEPADGSHDLLALSRAITTGRFVHGVHNPQHCATPVVEAVENAVLVKVRRSAENEVEQ